MVLVAAFGTVLTSDLPANGCLPGMGCSAIGSALIGDLFFLPAMLFVFGRVKP